jgi:hypothetical protein
MTRCLTFAALIAAFFASRGAAAQEEHGHFDVFVGRPDVGSQTTYGGIDVDDGDVTLGLRVFEAEMGENPLDNVFFSDEPGFNHPFDDALLPAGAASLVQGDELFVRALATTVGGVTADLFFWNGVGAASFTPASGVSFDIIAPLPNQSIGQAGAGGAFDDHPEFELSAGGSLPTPGIYLASFEVQVGVLDPSDPLFLVMGTDGLITPEFLGVSQAEFDLLTESDLDEALEGVIEIAVEFVESNVVVPEPSGLLLAALAGIGVGRTRGMQLG